MTKTDYIICNISILSCVSVCVRAHSAVVRVSSLQLFAQTFVCFSQQDELLVQQEDVLLQLLAAAQLETQTQQQTNITTNSFHGVKLRTRMVCGAVSDEDVGWSRAHCSDLAALLTLTDSWVSWCSVLYALLFAFWSSASKSPSLLRHSWSSL